MNELIEGTVDKSFWKSQLSLENPYHNEWWLLCHEARLRKFKGLGVKPKPDNSFFQSLEKAEVHFFDHKSSLKKLNQYTENRGPIFMRMSGYDEDDFSFMNEEGVSKETDDDELPF